MTANIVRDARGRIARGSAALNAKGRPRTGYAMAEIVRELGEDRGMIREILEIAFDVARMRPVIIDADWIAKCKAAREAGLPDPPREGEAVQPTLDQAHRAWEYIHKVGAYKTAAQEHEFSQVSDAPTFDYQKLSDEELDELERLQRKGLGVLDLPAGKPPDSQGSR